MRTMAIEPLADYVTVPEAARLLGVSESTIWRWIDRGDLPASRFGRRKVRIKREDLGRVVRPARSAPVDDEGWDDEDDDDSDEVVEELLRTKLTPEEARRGLAALERAKALA